MCRHRQRPNDNKKSFNRRLRDGADMKLGLVVVVAVAVFVPGMSEGRIVSKCELKERLGKAITLPKKLERFKEQILARVICEINRRSRLNTGLVRGKPRVTTTARPTSTITTTESTTIQTITTATTTEPTTTETTTTTEPTTAETTATETSTTEPTTTETSTTEPTTTETTTTEPTTTETTTTEPTTTETTTEPTTTETTTTEPTTTETTTETTTTETTVTEPTTTETTSTEPTTTETPTTEPTTTETTTTEPTTTEPSIESTLETIQSTIEIGGRRKREVGGFSNEENSTEVSTSLEEGQFSDEEGELDDNMSDEDEESDEEDDDMSEEDENNEGGERKKRWSPWRQRAPFYGLFQFGRDFCDSGRRSGNKCNTPCAAFIDDDITDDINCFVQTGYFTYVLNKASRSCRRTWNFFSECE